MIFMNYTYVVNVYGIMNSARFRDANTSIDCDATPYTELVVLLGFRHDHVGSASAWHRISTPIRGHCGYLTS